MVSSLTLELPLKLVPGLETLELTLPLDLVSGDCLGCWIMMFFLILPWLAILFSFSDIILSCS